MKVVKLGPVEGETTVDRERSRPRRAHRRRRRGQAARRREDRAGDARAARGAAGRCTPGCAAATADGGRAAKPAPGPAMAAPANAAQATVRDATRAARMARAAQTATTPAPYRRRRTRPAPPPQRARPCPPQTRARDAARADRRLMNPSRLFILRPVATSLLMVGVLLAGIVAYRVLPHRRAARGRLPDDPGGDALSGREPGRDDVVGHRAARAPVRPDAGPEPDVVDQLGRRSVITLQFSLDLSLDIAEQEVQAAINASNSFLPTDLPKPPIYSKVNPADAPIITLAVISQTMPLPKVEDLVDTRLAQKMSQLPGVGLVSHRRRAAAGGAHPGESARAGVVQPQHRRRAHRDRQRERQPGEGQLRRADARVDDRRQRPAALGRRVPQPDRRLSQQRRPSASRTSPT